MMGCGRVLWRFTFAAVVLFALRQLRHVARQSRASARASAPNMVASPLAAARRRGVVVMCDSRDPSAVAPALRNSSWSCATRARDPEVGTGCENSGLMAGYQRIFKLENQ